MQQFDIIVLGAGAAGLMAAATAGHRGRRVLLLDHADRIGKKILISGGGRANFTNLGCTHENFLSENPHFARSALARFTPADMVALVERHRIPYHEKTLGQLFCDRTARDLVDLLARECAEAHVTTRLETIITAVTHNGTHFTLETSAGPIRSTSLIVATGGLSIPKIGATGFGYDLARQFGLRIVTPRPALVPLTFTPADLEAWAPLAGVSTEVLATAQPSAPANPPAPHPSQRLTAVSESHTDVPVPHSSRRSSAMSGSPATKPRRQTPNPTFREKLLITHRGLSGPAILQASSYWQHGATLTLDLAPNNEVFTPLLTPTSRRDHAAALATLRPILPLRWAERWLAHHIPTPTQALSNESIAKLEAALHHWALTPAGTEGFAKAEVTAGGVSTADLDPRTCATRTLPTLFFIGEVVDVTGWLGGYNFQWAWASGYAAGQTA